MKKLKQLTIFIISMVLLISIGFGIEHQVSDETESGFYIHFTNKSPVLDKIIEQNIRQFSIKEAWQDRKSENFILPYFRFITALPTPQKPFITILNEKYKKIILDNPLSGEHYQILKNTKRIQFKNIGFLRHTPGGVLQINPIKIGQNENEILLLESATIQIKYKDVRQKNNYKNDKRSTVKSHTFVNSKFCSNWQHPRTTLLKKELTYPTGKWIKIDVTKTGIYTISYDELVSAGLSEQNIEHSKIFLFSNANSGREMTSKIGADIPENLAENSYKLIGNNDSYFNSGDTLLFFGQNTSGVDALENGNLTFNRNNYSNHNYYWICIAENPGTPKEMNLITNSIATPDSIVSEYEKLERHEIESQNFLQEGLDWFGKKFSSPGASVSEIFEIPQIPNINYSANIKVATIGTKEKATHSFQIFINNSNTPQKTWSTSSTNRGVVNFSAYMQAGINIFKIYYDCTLSSGEAFLDYVECNYKAPLNPGLEPMDFWAPNYNGLIKYKLFNVLSKRPQLFDISDVKNVKLQEFTKTSNNEISFSALNSDLFRNHYYITNSAEYLSPENIEILNSLSWNELRNSTNMYDYIIITDESLLEAAENLADFYNSEIQEQDRLKTKVFLQSDIFREFNGGVPDVHAIRFFLKYAFDNWAIAPQYVLLFGDGTNDHRGIDTNEGNLVFTYQVKTSLYSSYFASDCRYTYINGPDKFADIAIGRIPARTLTEAQNVVEKIKDYILDPVYGIWRSRITLVADDPQRPYNIEKEHISDSESRLVPAISPNFTIKKIYLLDYPEVQDASNYGVKKPAATEAILKQLEDGTVLINYLGHGSSTVWAQEYILQMERDLGKINTKGKLPIWFAGTCSWGEFDKINTQCMPEALVLKDGDGGIATLGGSKPTVGGTNSNFIRTIFQKWFSGDNISRLSLGKALQYSFDGNANNEKYILFGDPALYPAFPYNSAEFNTLATDTIKSLSRISISGNTAIKNYNGAGFLLVFDSDREVTRTYYDDSGNLKNLSYILPGELLFKGNINITDGQFGTNFIVPKDLNYAGLKGKINLYAFDEESRLEISGHYDNLIFHGSESIFDTLGPIINIGFEDKEFRKGDVIVPNETMKIYLVDPIGINISRQLGHNIQLKFDDDDNLSFQATEYFSYEANSDTSGYVTSPIPNMEPGIHRLSVTAWDNGNNRSVANTDFLLVADEELKIKNVLNYPNPFSNETQITFFLTQPGKISISIYTIHGLLINNVVQQEYYSAGFNNIPWDGKDDFGDEIARGIYIYKITVNSGNSSANDQYIGKMVKSR